MTTSAPVGDIAAVRAAITAGTQAAIAAGADRRYAFTGIWIAAISSVVGTASTKILAAAMEDYASNIRGLGTNVESPPLQFDPETRQETASSVSEAVIGYLESIHDQCEEEGVDAFKAILDVSFGILGEVWGPFHLRKNLALQAAAFREGVDAPILPLEPEVQNRREHSSRSSSPQVRAAEKVVNDIDDETPDFEQAEEASSATAGAPYSDAVGDFYAAPELREVEIIIEVSSWGSEGTGVFGVAVGISSGDAFHEVREFSGHISSDRTGRMTPLVASVEALRRLGRPAQVETVRIGINADFIVSACGLGGGLPGEEDLWSSLERAAIGRTVEWHVPTGGVGTELGRRSNRLTHERATQLGKGGLQ